VQPPLSLSKPSRRNGLWAAIGLGVLLVIISLFGARNQIIVFFVFALIAIEGAIIMGLLIGETAMFSADWIRSPAPTDESPFEAFLPADPKRPILSIAASVKNASEGSEYSRRVVARIIILVLQRRFGDLSSSRMKDYGNNLYEDEEFQTSLARIVYDYSPDRVRQSELLGTSDVVGRSISKDKYLQALGIILTKLGAVQIS
jgi:hypothetical protein